MKHRHNQKESKQRLLDTAENIFSLCGYEATSIRAIADGAHLNISMISYYFGSKEKLMFAVIKRRITEFQERIKNITAAVPDTGQRLHGLIALNLELMFEHRRFFRFLLKALWADSNECATDTVRQFFHSNMMLLQEILKEGIYKKVFRETDPELTGYSIFGTLIHAVVNDRLGNGQSEVAKKERIQAFFDHYFLDFLKYESPDETGQM